MDINGCPADVDEFAEAYALGTLSKEDADAFEEHYAGCDRCAGVLQRTADFIEALRAAAQTNLEEEN